MIHPFAYHPQLVHVEVALLAPQLLQHLPHHLGGGEALGLPAGGAIVETVLGMAPAQAERRLLPLLLGAELLLQRQALRQRLVEAEQVLGQQGPQWAIIGRNVVLEAAHQRLGDGLGHRGGKLQPPGGEPRAQEGDGNDGAALADVGGKLLQLLLIAEQLGAGRVEDATIHPLRLHQAAQIVQQVGEGYGGRAGAHPLGRHHHGQVEHQIPHHLEGGGAGPYDDAGPQLHRGHPRLPKQLAAVATGVEMAAVAGDRLYGPQIDDAAHPGGAGGGGEVLHPLLLQPVKTGACPHGVHQIEDGIHPGKGRQQGDRF